MLSDCVNRRLRRLLCPHKFNLLCRFLSSLITKYIYLLTIRWPFRNTENICKKLFLYYIVASGLCSNQYACIQSVSSPITRQSSRVHAMQQLSIYHGHGHSVNTQATKRFLTPWNQQHHWLYRVALEPTARPPSRSNHHLFTASFSQQKVRCRVLTSEQWRHIPLTSTLSLPFWT